MALPYISDPQLVGFGVEGHAPGVAQAVCPDLIWDVVIVYEWIVGGMRYGSTSLDCEMSSRMMVP